MQWGRASTAREPSIRECIAWLLSFFRQRFGVHMVAGDIQVASACRSSKLSLHLAAPYRLVDGQARRLFKEHLREAGEGREIVEKLAGGLRGWFP